MELLTTQFCPSSYNGHTWYSLLLSTNKILEMLQLHLCDAEDEDGIILQKQLTNYKV